MMKPQRPLGRPWLDGWEQIGSEVRTMQTWRGYVNVDMILSVLWIYYHVFEGMTIRRGMDCILNILHVYVITRNYK
jgi:hypothetical protein